MAPPELLVRLSPRSRATLRYTVLAEGRGEFEATEVHLRVRSRFGAFTLFFNDAARARFRNMRPAPLAKEQPRCQAG